jgi:hypothetical protein
LTAGGASTLTRLLAMQGRAVVLSDALQSALKRSRLAAAAKDAKAEKMQNRFIGLLAPKLANLLRSQVTLNGRVQRFLVSANRGALSYEIARPATYAKILRALGPPRLLVSYMRLIGAPAQMVTSTWNTRPPPGAVSIDLSADVASPDAIAQLTQTADALAELAERIGSQPE